MNSAQIGPGDRAMSEISKPAAEIDSKIIGNGAAEDPPPVQASEETSAADNKIIGNGSPQMVDSKIVGNG